MMLAAIVFATVSSETHGTIFWYVAAAFVCALAAVFAIVDHNVYAVLMAIGVACVAVGLAAGL